MFGRSLAPSVEEVVHRVVGEERKRGSTRSSGGLSGWIREFRGSVPPGPLTMLHTFALVPATGETQRRAAVRARLFEPSISVLRNIHCSLGNEGAIKANGRRL